MRHSKSGRKLNRNSSHRKAMFRNMANSLFEHEIIKTTVPKAKELRRVAEPLITLAKEDSVAHRRLAFDRRPGGYLRIMKCGYRSGDKAPMAYVELVGRPRLDDEQDDTE